MSSTTRTVAKRARMAAVGPSARAAVVAGTRPHTRVPAVAVSMATEQDASAAHADVAAELSAFAYMNGGSHGGASAKAASPGIIQSEAPAAEDTAADTHTHTHTQRPAASKLQAVPVRDGVLPFVSNFKFKSMHGRWRERYSAVCRPCFDSIQPCLHFPELPLRALLVGHNPSDHAFQSGFFYSNPTNRMWSLLTGTFGVAPDRPRYPGIAPADWPMSSQNLLPLHVGVGLTDLGVEPGNDAAKYSIPVLHAWRDEMFVAMAGHMRRAARSLERCWHIVHGGSDGASAAARVGKRARPDEDDASFETNSSHWKISKPTAAAVLDLAGQLRGAALTRFEDCSDPRATAPRYVAFTGKAQWKALFSPPLAQVDAGVQPRGLRPAAWPFPADTDVFVLPSSSGRAAMTIEARRAPYAELARLVHALPWLPTEVVEEVAGLAPGVSLKAGTPGTS